MNIQGLPVESVTAGGTDAALGRDALRTRKWFEHATLMIPFDAPNHVGRFNQIHATWKLSNGA